MHVNMNVKFILFLYIAHEHFTVKKSCAKKTLECCTIVQFHGWNTEFTSKLFMRFFLNNQPDALIIQIYSVIKLYIFRASSLPIIRSFLLYIRHW
jgi:hypothetical protein